MAQNRRVNRIIFVFSLIGKPLYWLLLSPVLFYFKLRNLIGYNLQRFLLHGTRKNSKRTQKRNKRPKYFKRIFQKLRNRISHAKKKLKKKLSFFRGWLIFQTPKLPKLKFTWSPKLDNPKIKSESHFKFPRFSTFLFYGVTSSLLISIIFGGYWFYQNILKDLPTPQDLVNHRSPLTTKIYDKNHNLLYKIYKDENRSWVHLSNISPHVIDATISMEDKEFYSHWGISLRGILRSLKLALTDGRIQGGSTITQQLVKNTLLTPERTIIRKLKEIILALQVERVLEKDKILEMYLNEVSYGGSVYGIEEASVRYFHKTAAELSLAEATFLAGLPASPTIFSPLGPNPELAVKRQQEVIRRMVEDEKISALQAESLKLETLNVFPPIETISAPHFVMYVRDILAKEYGEDLVNSGGLEVITTLDLSLQKEAELTVQDEVERLASKKVSNGAALITNPKTGEILAMVGSKNYFDNHNDGQVNVTLRPRQPGSSIKPLMYSAALLRGYTPATLIDDSPVSYTPKGGVPYTPKNYDGKFHGLETLRVALANSHNVPAVKTLNTIGLSAFINQAKAMGITTWEETNRFGLSLTLGGGEVKMVDLATAYGVFANGGERIDLNPILSVTNHLGKNLYQNQCALDGKCQGLPVLDPRVAFQITSILSDNLARSQAFGFNSVLHIPGQQVAVKTGTTNSLRDNWTIGYTSDRLVATWVGNNNNSPMSAVVSGITGASPIWNKIIKSQLTAGRHIFTPPAALTAIMVCDKTGKPSCGECAHAYTEYFLPETAPKGQCRQTAGGLPNPDQEATALSQRTLSSN